MQTAAISFYHRFRPILRSLHSGFVRLRAYVAALCLVIVILATGLFSLNAYHTVGDRLGRLIHVNARLTNHLDDVRSATDRLNAAFVLHLAGDVEKAEELHKGSLEVLAERAESLDAMRERLSSKLSESVADVSNKLEHIERHARRFFEIEGNDPYEEQLIERYAAHLSPYLLELADAVREAQTLNYEKIAEGGDATQDAVVTGIRLLMFMILVVSVAVLYGVYLYAFRVFRPVQRLSRAIRQLAVGSAKQPLPEFSKSDLGAFARPMNLIVRRLERTRKHSSTKINRMHRTLEASMASLTHPLFVLDARGEILLINPAGRNFLDSIDLTDGTDRLPGTLNEVVLTVRNDAEDLNPRDLAGAIAFDVNGTERYFIPRVTRLVDNDRRLHGFTLLLEDVTDLRLIDELRSNLIGVIGHELQTPMTVVRMALHLLRKNAYDGLSPENQEVLQSALDDTETLQKTLQNLLDLNRIDSQGIGLNRARWIASRDLRSAVQRFCRTHRVDPDFVDIDTPDDLPEIIVDRDRLDHALMNILANARRFTPDGEQVRMRARSLPDGWLRISVADNGPGIPEKYQSRVFEAFFRVPGQGTNGAGLGLCIAERIIRMHGGRILVDSDGGHGATFHIDLPVNN
ncbi:MAG: hypothetical protein JJU00_06650 [Opitutales bacterium]|nr:hypothetical protein [Opitutales bacterium]